MSTLFPNVPIAPGVPPVARDAFNPVTTFLGPILTADLVSWGSPEPAWGIYSGGGLVISAETVIQFSFRKDWAVADYPVERGGFESYDKVERPYEARVTFASGADGGARASLLASVAAIAGDLNLYDVVTPEIVYVNANVSHYDYRRQSRNGVGLVIVDVWLQQINESGTADQTLPGAPASSNPSTIPGAQPVQQGADENGFISTWGGSDVNFDESGFVGAWPTVQDPAVPQVASPQAGGTVNPVDASPGVQDLITTAPFSAG